MNKKALVPILLLVAGLIGGFFGGMQYRNYQLQKARGNFGANGNFQRFNGARPSGQNGGMMGRGGVAGSILSMDENADGVLKSITVKLADGSSKIVLFSASTTYSNTVNATKTDLKVGQNVAVFGAANSDGSVTATNVQINPEFGRINPSPVPSPK
jgi:hypothetical protein